MSNVQISANFLSEIEFLSLYAIVIVSSLLGGSADEVVKTEQMIKDTNMLFILFIIIH